MIKSKIRQLESVAGKFERRKRGASQGVPAVLQLGKWKTQGSSGTRTKGDLKRGTGTRGEYGPYEGGRIQVANLMCRVDGRGGKGQKNGTSINTRGKEKSSRGRNWRKKLKQTARRHFRHGAGGMGGGKKETEEECSREKNQKPVEKACVGNFVGFRGKTLKKAFDNTQSRLYIIREQVLEQGSRTGQIGRKAAPEQENLSQKRTWGKKWLRPRHEVPDTNKGEK